MKLYCFYKYDRKMSKEQYKQQISSGLTTEDIYPIYALTTNKKFKKQFMEERDMSKFLLVTHEDDKEIVTMFLNARRSSLLDIYEYRYCKSNGEETKIPILSTYSEYNMCINLTEEGGGALDEIFNLDFSNPFILKEKYLSVLKDLDYDSLFKFQFTKNMNITDDFDLTSSIGTYNVNVPEDEGFPDVPNFILDEFGIFIHSYGDLFK